MPDFVLHTQHHLTLAFLDASSDLKNMNAVVRAVADELIEHGVEAHTVFGRIAFHQREAERAIEIVETAGFDVEVR